MVVAGGARPAETGIVIACGTSVTHLTEDELSVRPQQDFALLQERFDSVTIDPYSVTQTRFGRLVDRTFGASWLIGYRTVRAARDGRVIVAMADDVGVPILAASALMRSTAPSVVIVQHLRTRRARLLLGRLGLHRRASVFLAMSTTLRDLLIDEFDVEPERIRMLYDTVDHRFFEIATDAPARRQICSAGTAARDYRTLLSATRGLDVDVLIEANSAWYEQPVNFEAADIHDRVQLCDDGTTMGLREIYANSMIVVVPVLDVGYPAGYTTIMEAMAMGKPVVTTDISMRGDFIVDGESGFLVPPNDPDALRAVLQRLMADDELRRRVGLAARRRIEQHYTRDRFADHVGDAIAVATGSSGG